MATPNNQEQAGEPNYRKSAQLQDEPTNRPSTQDQDSAPPAVTAPVVVNVEEDTIFFVEKNLKMPSDVERFQKLHQTRLEFREQFKEYTIRGGETRSLKVIFIIEATEEHKDELLQLKEAIPASIALLQKNKVLSQFTETSYRFLDLYESRRNDNTQSAQMYFDQFLDKKSAIEKYQFEPIPKCQQFQVPDYEKFKSIQYFITLTDFFDKVSGNDEAGAYYIGVVIAKSPGHLGGDLGDSDDLVQKLNIQSYIAGRPNIANNYYSSCSIQQNFGLTFIRTGNKNVKTIEQLAKDKQGKVLFSITQAKDIQNLDKLIFDVIQESIDQKNQDLFKNFDERIFPQMTDQFAAFLDKQKKELEDMKPNENKPPANNADNDDADADSPPQPVITEEQIEKNQVLLEFLELTASSQKPFTGSSCVAPYSVQKWSERNYNSTIKSITEMTYTQNAQEASYLYNCIYLTYFFEEAQKTNQIIWSDPFKDIKVHSRDAYINFHLNSGYNYNYLSSDQNQHYDACMDLVYREALIVTTDINSEYSQYKVPDPQFVAQNVVYAKMNALGKMILYNFNTALVSNAMTLGKESEIQKLLFLKQVYTGINWERDRNGYTQNYFSYMVGTFEQYSQGLEKLYENITNPKKQEFLQYEIQMNEALTHFSFVASAGTVLLKCQVLGECLICQPTFYHKDPNSDPNIFGQFNNGGEQILKFIENHQCNPFCDILNLRLAMEGNQIQIKKPEGTQFQHHQMRIQLQNFNLKVRCQGCFGVIPLPEFQVVSEHRRVPRNFCDDCTSFYHEDYSDSVIDRCYSCKSFYEKHITNKYGRDLLYIDSRLCQQCQKDMGVQDKHDSHVLQKLGSAVISRISEMKKQ